VPAVFFAVEQKDLAYNKSLSSYDSVLYEFANPIDMSLKGFSPSLQFDMGNLTIPSSVSKPLYPNSSLP